MSTLSLTSLTRLPNRPTKVLILGGCYAGLSAALNLLDLCEGKLPRFAPAESDDKRVSLSVEITIVDERDGYHHIIGSPLAFASQEYARKAWVKFSDIPGLQHSAIKIIQGSVSGVDIMSKTAQIRTSSQDQTESHSYDYLIAATGLRRTWPVVSSKFTRQEYIQQADEHIKSIQQATKKVVVIGGGAVGIEMAAELKAVEPAAQVILVHSRELLLSSEPLPDSFKEAMLPLVRDQGVEVITGSRVISQTPSEDSNILGLSNGSTIEASVVINAISNAIPTTTYLPKDVLNDEGFVKIKASTHFHDEYHLAAGDIAQWTGIKRCGSAMHMGFISGYNIYQHMLTGRLHSPVVDRIADSFNDLLVGGSPEYKNLDVFPAVIGIAIGHTAAAYSPQEGIKSGPETLKYLFGDDLAFDYCYKYLRLGEPAQKVLAEPDALETLEEGQITPTLSTSSTDDDSSSLVEPKTPYDAVGNAEVTNFEVLGAIKGVGEIEVGLHESSVEA